MRTFKWAVLFLFFCETSFGFELEPEPEEGPPVFFANSLLDEDLLTGEYYQVGPVVRVERFRYRFTLQSEFGEVDVWGIEGVKEGAAELQAIALLKEIGQSESFARAFSTALQAPVVKAWTIATRPVQTVTGIPMGINRYLLGKFYQVKRESRRAASYMRKKTDNGNDSLAEVEDDEKEAVSKKFSQGTGKLSRKHLGFNKAKRQWARRLHVDPYSKNPLLQQELGRIAWAASLGSFSADFAIPGSDALSYANRAESVVWSKSPTELERLNDIALRKMNFDKEMIAAFHDNRLYSLTQKVEIVMALKAMGEIGGQRQLLDLAMGAVDDHDTVFMTSIIDVLAAYNERISSLERVEIRRGLAVGFNEKGVMILPLALDYLHWSPEIAQAVREEDWKSDKRELWITGKASPVTKYRLQRLGWGVEELCNDAF